MFSLNLDHGLKFIEPTEDAPSFICGKSENVIRFFGNLMVNGPRKRKIHLVQGVPVIKREK